MPAISLQKTNPFYNSLYFSYSDGKQEEDFLN